MRKLWSKILGLGTALWVAGPAIALAAGGPSGPPMVIVADTRKLEGIMAWWANLYNESHVYFTITHRPPHPRRSGCASVSFADIDHDRYRHD